MNGFGFGPGERGALPANLAVFLRFRVNRRSHGAARAGVA